MIRTQTSVPGLLLYIAAEHFAAAQFASYSGLVCDATGTSGNPSIHVLLSNQVQGKMMWMRKSVAGVGEEGPWVTGAAPGARAASTLRGRVLEGCAMDTVDTQGHRVPSDAIFNVTGWRFIL